MPRHIGAAMIGLLLLALGIRHQYVGDGVRHIRTGVALRHIIEREHGHLVAQSPQFRFGNFQLLVFEVELIQCHGCLLCQPCMSYSPDFTSDAWRKAESFCSVLSVGAGGGAPMHLNSPRMDSIVCMT